MKERLLFNPPKREKILLIKSGENAIGSPSVAQSKEEATGHIELLDKIYKRLAEKTS